MIVRASVVDIRKVAARPGDDLFVDTNVLLSLFYEPDPDSTEKAPYRNWINRAVDIGAKLYKCSLSLAEIAHSIEREELRAWSKERGGPIGDYHDRLKRFRAIPEARTKVANKIKLTWKQAAIAKSLKAGLGERECDTLLSQLESHVLDAYDALLLHAMRADGIYRLVTDDSDFACVEGIEIYTCLPRLLNEARAQGRLGRINV